MIPTYRAAMTPVEASKTTVKSSCLPEKVTSRETEPKQYIKKAAMVSDPEIPPANSEEGKATSARLSRSLPLNFPN